MAAESSESAKSCPSRVQFLALLLLFLALYVLLDFRYRLPVVFGAGIHGVNRIAEHELILSCLGRIGVGSVLKRSQFRLKLNVSIDHELERSADVVLAADVGVDVLI